MTSTVVTEKPTPSPSISEDELHSLRLTIADRCDRCSAQGQVLLLVEAKEDGVSQGKKPLTFCKHHFEGAEVKLVALGASIIEDKRGDIR